MDSTEFNKIAGAFIGAFLVLMLLNFFAGQIYGTREVAHHGDEVLAFAVEIEETEASDEAEPEIDLLALVGAADPGKGEKGFSKCKACHKVEDGANAVGPHLWGIVGREIAGIEGYGYSDALNGIEGSWNLEELSAFLEAPKDYAPGTKMAFAGISDAEDRINLIAYLNDADGTPEDLTEGLSAPSDDGADASDTTETEQETAAVETDSTTESEAETEATTEDAAATETEESSEETAATEAEPATEDAASETSTEATETESTSEEAEATTESETTETAAATTESEPEPAEPASGGVFAAADVEAGKKVFRRCRACHKVEEGKNGVGPTLWGVVGRQIAAIEGFSYSDAMAAQGGDWTGQMLLDYLEDPKGVVPGTKMVFSGLKDLEDRVNLIAYLNEADGSPEPLE